MTMTTIEREVTKEAVEQSVRAVITGVSVATEEFVWQVTNHAWKMLGYKSWADMRQAEYDGDAVLRPTRDSMPEVVYALRKEAEASQKEIADTLSISARTVRRVIGQMPHGDPLSHRVNAKGAVRGPHRKVEPDPMTANQVGRRMKKKAASGIPKLPEDASEITSVEAVADPAVASATAEETPVFMPTWPAEASPKDQTWANEEAERIFKEEGRMRAQALEMALAEVLWGSKEME